MAAPSSTNLEAGHPHRVGVPAWRHIESRSLRRSRSVMTVGETLRTWLCWEDPELAGEATLPRTRALPGSAGWWRSSGSLHHGALELSLGGGRQIAVAVFGD